MMKIENGAMLIVGILIILLLVLIAMLLVLKFGTEILTVFTGKVKKESPVRYYFIKK